MDALPPCFEFVLHPTDLGDASMRALRHAVRIALGSHGTLRMLHVLEDDEAHAAFPSVRALLAEWGLLDADADAAAVRALGLTVDKVERRHHEPALAIAEDAAWHEADLLVMATHARPLLTRAFVRSVAEPAARRARVPTLFLPPDTRDFVHPGTGAPTLARVLVPVAASTSPALGIEGAARIARSLGAEGVTFRLLHVGGAGQFPRVSPLEHPGWTWERRSVDERDVVDAIVGEASDWGADLVVMATRGHDDPVDLVLGSRMERVVRSAPCPVLSMPLGQDVD